MRRRHLFVLSLLLLAGVLLALGFAGRMLQPALGFAAKVGCSNALVGGASVEQVRAAFPDARLRDVIRLRIDSVDGWAEAGAPLLGRRRAVHRPGLGCVLEPRTGTLRPLPVALPPRALVPDTGAWLGSPLAAPELAPAAASRLQAVVDSAFREPAAGPARRTLAVVVVHDGRIVAERYAPGYSAVHRFPGWSMAKSVTSALTGIRNGDRAVELDAAALRPEWREDGRARITLRHLLHMSSGLAFDERYSPTGGATRMLFDAADVAAVAAASPLVHVPGTRWQYSSATTNLITDHLRRSFGGDDAAYLDFPRARLFGPVGMHSAVLETDATGTFVGSSFLFATARDWARFGQLYLDDGIWEGTRVLPEGWVSFSVAPAPAAPLGRYGAQWWLNAGDAENPARRPWPELPRDVYWASGFQGQYVAVLPSQRLVVVRLGLTDDEAAFRLGPFLRGVIDAVALSADAPASAPPPAR